MVSHFLGGFRVHAAYRATSERLGVDLGAGGLERWKRLLCNRRPSLDAASLRWRAMGGSKERKGFRAALVHRDFRLLLASLTASGIGDWFYNVALIVYILDVTNSQVGWPPQASGAWPPTSCWEAWAVCSQIATTGAR